MPQLDFRQALSSPTDPVFPAVPPLSSGQEDRGVAGFARQNTNRNGASRIGRSDWANLIFAILALLGGLFSAFCFFNGNELMRAAIAWPGELTYVRPSSTLQTAKIVVSDRVTEQSSRSAARDSSDEGRDPEPFGPDVGSLDRVRSSTLSAPNDGANSVLTSPSSPADSIFDQLTGPIPGADGLSQIFDQAVADLEQAKILDAKRTVVVIQTPPSVETRARAAASLKAARQQLANAKATAAQAAQNAQSTAATTTNTGISSTGSTVGNLGRPGMGLGGIGGGIGGIGGIGGGVGGGLPGGGIGGLGGGRH